MSFTTGSWRSWRARGSPRRADEPRPPHDPSRRPSATSERSSAMLLVVIRALFVLVAAGMGVRVARAAAEQEVANPYVVFGAIMIAAVVLLVVDLLTPRKRIQTISAIYFGLVVGVVLSNLVRDALEPMLSISTKKEVHLA